MRLALEPRSSTSATLSGVLAIVLWSTTIAFSRSIAEQLGTFTGAATVYLGAGLLGCSVLASRGRLLPAIREASSRHLLGCGSLMVVYTVLLYAAVGMSRDRAEIVAVTVANYLWPSLTLLFSVGLLGWRARPLQLAAGTAVALTGVALAVGMGPENSALRSSWFSHASTTLLAVLAAIAWGLYSVLSRRWGSQAQGGAMCVFLLATGLVLLLFRCVVAEQTAWTWGVAGEVAYVAVGPTLLAYVGWDAAARRGNLALVAALSYLTPVLSVAISSVYLGLAIQPLQWLAGGMVVVGAICCRRATR